MLKSNRVEDWSFVEGEGRTGMAAFQSLRWRSAPYLFNSVRASLLWVACVAFIGSFSQPMFAQDLSWVSGAMERSKTAVRESLPAWQYDPRVVASNLDASLNAVTAVNPDRLVAVGDRGLILASTDGGRSWQTQASQTSLNLYSVAFFDEQRGVAVGGTVQPLSQSSVGIVLLTSDGGKSWQSVSVSAKASLPRLTGVSIDERTLRAWGDYSSAHSSAVFESHDQGHSWQPVPAPLGHMQSVARERYGLILGLDHAGRLAQIPHNPNRTFQQLAAPTAPIHSLIHTGSQWLAVGDGASITTSRDGVNWVDHALPLSPSARAVSAFSCATTMDQNIWVAGSPGSILLHSPDAGQSWRVVPLEQTWSISSIRFVDRHRGWFVTSAGSIWATRDGGASWFAQRMPVKRLGLLSLATSATDISWPTLGHATWQARQATELVTLYRENIDDTVDVTPDAPATISTLGAQIGLISALNPSRWPTSGSRVQLPSTTSDRDQSTTSIEQFLAMRLRMGKPSVVLVDDLPGASVGNDQMAELTSHALWLAENDQPAMAWLTTELHLPPWKVNKLLSVSAADRADITISAEELMRDSGLAMQDVLAPLFGKESLTTSNSCLKCLQLATGNNANRQNLFSNQERSPEATRAVELSKIGNLQLVMGRAHREKAWHSLGPTPLSADEDLNLWIKKLDTIIQQTPKHECGAALLQLAERCLAAHQWERWSIIVERVTGQSPLSDCARYGSLLTIRMLASEEFLAWQSQSISNSKYDESDPSGAPPRIASTSKAMRMVSPQESDPFDSPANANKNRLVTANETFAPVQTVSAEEALPAIDTTRITALRRAIAEFTRLGESDRALVARPDLQLAHFARRRALAELAGEPAPDTGLLQALTTKSWLAGWPQVAAQEFIMAGGRAERPVWTARATRAPEAPALNGLADDKCWQSATAIELANPFLPSVVSTGDNALATKALFAYDDEFLYVYVACPQVSLSETKSSTKTPNRRDMNLEGTDHFALQLDTDRDYSSCCELAVNQAGHTYDHCCQYSQWNPQWYRAVHQSATTWSAEFAVRISDLTTRSPVVGSAWAISAFRYVPNWGLQSWSQLRSTSPRAQGHGLLVFE